MYKVTGFYTKNLIDIKSFVGGAIFSSTYEYWNRLRNFVIFKSTEKANKGLYIKYVGGGTGGFLWGSWNILGNMLLGREIFFKIFDGPQNMF